MEFFNSLSPLLQGLAIVLCTLGFMSLLFFLCICVSRRKNIALTVVTAIIALLSAVNIIRLSHGAPIVLQNDAINSKSAVIISISANIFLGIISFILLIVQLRKPRVSAAKIPQYLENSKDAVLFADKSGRPLLINQEMRGLTRLVTGIEYFNEYGSCPAFNANQFRDAVLSSRTNGRFTVFNVDSKRIFRFSPMSAWEFSCTELYRGGYTIIATDVTQTLNTAEKITENKRDIKESKNRLQWTLDNLDDFKKQNEIAEITASLRSHLSEYANGLYEGIEANGDIAPKQVGLQIIPPQNRLDLITGAFELIGVSINVIGKMPYDSDLSPTLLELLCVCASNAVSFCRAEHVTMAIYEGGNKITTNINCDGATLIDKNSDSFSIIQNRIASLGGTFTLTREPSLKISVILPK